MKPVYHYATVSEALEDLKKKGFSQDFNLHDEAIKNNPHHYEIEHVYRYEGDTDPDEEAVVYGIKSSSGQKGVYVSGYSANSENETDRVLNEIIIKRRFS